MNAIALFVCVHMIKEQQLVYTVERKDAAAFLGVSLRTIDRYIRSNKLSHRKSGYNVYLNQEELTRMNSGRVETVSSVDIVHMDNDVTAESQQPMPDFRESAEGQESFETLVYKGLYESTKKELLKKQHEIDGLNYRLGQVEVELKNTIPLLAYNEKNEQQEKHILDLKDKLVDTRETVFAERMLRDKAIREKRFFLGLTLFFTSVSVILYALLTANL